MAIASHERAILVGLDIKTRARPSTPDAIPFTAEESLEELSALAASAGASILEKVIQSRPKADAATLVGAGKLDELRAMIASEEADVVILDSELTPTQQRNLERALEVKVIDRTQLILDIFASRARTREGQLQVEIAQLNYLLPRLTGKGVSMSRLGGGIGTRGPGETKLETDRRRIHNRLKKLNDSLEHVRSGRGTQRQQRQSVPLATLALVGYTNAGKSTLFNALTNAAVLQSPRMFATLDPTIRSVALPSRRKVLLSDTVGFIRNLPHTLVSAFRATLEEVQRASLVLHVSDASSPLSAEQDAQVDKVLQELEVDGKPRLRVMNKIDLLLPKQRESLLDDATRVHVSAAKGTGMTTLLDRIDEMLSEDPISRVHLRVPQKEGKLLSLLEARSRIYSRKYTGGSVELEVEAPESVVREVKQWIKGNS